MRKSQRKQCIPYILVLVLLMIAIFYDYAIDDALYQPGNLFGLFFERIILIPVELLLPIGFMVLFRCTHRWFYILCYVISCGYIVGDAIHFWQPLDTIIIPLIFMMLLFMIILSFLLQQMPLTFCEKYRKFFTFTLLVILSSLFITTVLKQLWGRVRYREMLDNVSLFTPWFLPQGMNSHNSFPSGHTTMMSCVLCFLEVYRARGIHRRISIPSYMIVIVLIMLMMFSRMLVGAHFLSDVCVGFAITYTMYLFWRKRLFREEFI